MAVIVTKASFLFWLNSVIYCLFLMIGGHHAYPMMNQQAYAQDLQLAILLNNIIFQATNIPPARGIIDKPWPESSSAGEKLINLGSRYRNEEDSTPVGQPRSYIAKLTMTLPSYGESYQPQKIKIEFAPGAGNSVEPPAQQLTEFLKQHNISATYTKSPDTGGYVSLTYDDDLIDRLRQINTPETGLPRIRRDYGGGRGRF
jgi:hypothetical protein